MAERELTASELARQLGLRQSTVWRWQHRKADPMRNVARVAAYFNVSEAYLLGWTDQRSNGSSA